MFDRLSEQRQSQESILGRPNDIVSVKSNQHMSPTSNPVIRSVKLTWFKEDYINLNNFPLLYAGLYNKR